MLDQARGPAIAWPMVIDDLSADQDFPLLLTYFEKKVSAVFVHLIEETDGPLCAGATEWVQAAKAHGVRTTYSSGQAAHEPICAVMESRCPVSSYMLGICAPIHPNTSPHRLSRLKTLGKSLDISSHSCCSNDRMEKAWHTWLNVSRRCALLMRHP